MSEATTGDGITAAPAPTQAELDAASAAKYQAQLAGGVVDEPLTDDAVDPPTRPENVPEKFWNAEKGEVDVDNLLKSYTELEKAKAPPADPADPSSAPPAAEGVLAEFATLRSQATEKLTAGEELTPEMYEQFEKKHGLSKQDVDTFIEGQKAIGQIVANAVYAEAGGEDAYRTMIGWARESYSPEEVAAYDRDIHSGDPAVRLNAVRGLAARYEKANGRTGIDVTKGGGGGGPVGYASGAEMRADMKTEQYRKDPAFRAEVARKASVARAAGVDLAL